MQEIDKRAAAVGAPSIDEALKTGRLTERLNEFSRLAQEQQTKLFGAGYVDVFDVTSFEVSKELGAKHPLQQHSIVGFDLEGKTRFGLSFSHLGAQQSANRLFQSPVDEILGHTGMTGDGTVGFADVKRSALPGDFVSGATAQAGAMGRMVDEYAMSTSAGLTVLPGRATVHLTPGTGQLQAIGRNGQTLLAQPIEPFTSANYWILNRDADLITRIKPVGTTSLVGEAFPDDLLAA